MSSDIKKDNNTKQYDAYYNKPDVWFKYRYRTRIKDLYCKFLIESLSVSRKDSTIVELGFGHANVILSFPITNNIVGFELSQSAISKAEKRASQKGFKNFKFYPIAGCPNIGHKVKKAAIVIASHVLEHVEDDRRIAKEIYNLLEPGGRFVVLVPVNEFKEDPNHVRVYTPDSCRLRMEGIGFKCARIIEFDYFFSFLERIYWGRGRGFWGLINGMLWKMISAPLGFCSFGGYRFLDKVALKFGSASPHQVGFVFEK